jgi:hypothetical protein
MLRERHVLAAHFHRERAGDGAGIVVQHGKAGGDELGLTASSVFPLIARTREQHTAAERGLAQHRKQARYIAVPDTPLLGFREPAYFIEVWHQHVAFDVVESGRGRIFRARGSGDEQGREQHKERPRVAS